MPVDKFGRMSDTKTKDTGVSLTYINNNYVRSDGGTPLTGSLDMRGNTIYNVADPVNPQDVVTKVYVDNRSKHLITVHARYCGPLKKGEYQFKFSGANFKNCEEIIGKYEDLKGSITGFVMPHSGHIKKIICESLAYRSLEDLAEFVFNFISDHKKEIQISDIPVFKKVGYVDIEDILKKGIDELKKIMEKENNFGETKTFLETYDNTKFEFQIVKFEKSFNPKDYLTVGTLPKIISSVLIEAMNVKILTFNKKMVGVGSIKRNLNNDYFTLSEGDVINIKSNYTHEEKIPPFNRGNIKRIFELKFDNFITIGLNFNFTFLIELDPL